MKAFWKKGKIRCNFSNSASSSVSLWNVTSGNNKPTWIPAGLIKSKAPTVLKTNFTTLLKLSSPILQEASVKNTMSALAPLHTERPRKGTLKMHQSYLCETKSIVSKFENSRMTNTQLLCRYMANAHTKYFIKNFQRKVQEMKKSSRIKCKCYKLLGFFPVQLPYNIIAYWG